jgi:HEAT repeat protein
MKERTLKRLMIGLIVLLVIALGVFVGSPASYFRLLGLLRREATYAGQPASYWLAALKKEPFVSGSAPRDVGKALREGGPHAVPVLLELLGDPDPFIRSQVLLTLMLIGPDPEQLRPALMQALRREDESGCFKWETDMLAALDRPAAMATLLAVLQEEARPQGRLLAMEALVQLHAAEAAPALRAALRAPELAVRVRAAQTLWLCTGDASELLPILLAGLDSPEQSTRDWSVQGLIMIGRKSRPTIQPLMTKALHDPNGERRYDAARVLQQIGPDPQALLELLAALKDSEVKVRRQAAHAISFGQPTPKLQEEQRKAVDAALAAALQDEDKDVRRTAAWALRARSSSSPSVTKALIEALQHDPDDSVREAVAGDFKQGGSVPPALVAALSAALKSDRSEMVRCQALWSLANLSLQPQEKVPLVVAALHDPADSVRDAAVTAMYWIGPEAKPAVPELLAALKREQRQAERAAMVEALGRIRAGGPEVIQALEAALRERDTETRAKAAWALWKIDPKNQLMAPVLWEDVQKRLKDSPPQLRPLAGAVLSVLDVPTRKPAIGRPNELEKAP